MRYTMDLSSGASPLTLSLVIFLLICKQNWAAESAMDVLQHSTGRSSTNSLNSDENERSAESEKRIGSSRDLLRMFLMALNQNYPNGIHYSPRLGGIPFRPARRIGSEFLGKRSISPSSLTSEELDQVIESLSPAFYPQKRARGMGSEFLGKRRLGSEFLGKRTSGSPLQRDMSDEDLMDDSLEMEYPPWAHPRFLDGATGLEDQLTTGSNPTPRKLYVKRALGTEFLGKRRYYGWSPKRARLGSEFLGKRALGNEFLGKRAHPLNTIVHL